jgi:hypothetical protein
MQIHIRNHWRDGPLSRHVVSLASFAMLTAALCCAASVLGERAPESTRALACEAPRILHSNVNAAEQRPALSRDWREERSAAMIERMDKCESVSLGSSPTTCFSESL